MKSAVIVAAVTLVAVLCLMGGAEAQPSTCVVPGHPCVNDEQCGTCGFKCVSGKCLLVKKGLRAEVDEEEAEEEDSAALLESADSVEDEADEDAEEDAEDDAEDEADEEAEEEAEEEFEDEADEEDASEDKAEAEVMTDAGLEVHLTTASSAVEALRMEVAAEAATKYEPFWGRTPECCLSRSMHDYKTSDLYQACTVYMMWQCFPAGRICDEDKPPKEPSPITFRVTAAHKDASLGPFVCYAGCSKCEKPSPSDISNRILGSLKE